MLVSLLLSQNVLAESNVVIPREEFVKILTGIQFLSEDRDNLIQQVQLLHDNITLLSKKDVVKDKVIDNLEDINTLYKEQEDIFNEEINNLNSTIDREEMFNKIKDYLLVGTLGALAVLLIAGL